MAEGFRVTYATMSADNEELHKGYDEGIELAKAELGKTIPVVVNGQERPGEGTYELRSPIDDDIVLAHISQATRQDVEDAVAAAKGFAIGWDRMGWRKRVEIINNAADLITERRNLLSALMALEVGKNRLEALGDVEETADLMRWNAKEMVEHDGFNVPMQAMGAAGQYYDVLRPFGVWAVISPFNFPMALAGGPSSGALVAGNTVLFKPAHQGALLGYKLYEIYRDAGVPDAAFHFIPGRGSIVGDVIVHHPDVDGITFTGSYEVGMGIYRTFASEYPKPAICEMGGKNPTIVTKNADLDKATDGVMRSSFGFGGQKCSANSRVYVERAVYDDFVAKLKEKTEAIKVGNPLERDVFLGPVINDAAVKTYEEASDEARKNGTIVTGGERITEGDLARGTFVKPTVVEVPLDNWIWKKELFVPFVAVAPIDSLDQALELANDSEYGLTAGFYSEDEDEQQEFLDRIEAGVVYVNRRAGATTGAWPGVQPFGGWKGSGTTGKAGGGPYYVTQYMREQSRTVIAE
ncbi:MAG: aldehyde dehydrogenase family protein [Actinomycetota bacterium]|nr:aldehyde dehydrogenase family protein [Actinomycetota bacterium]